jgi:teichuronic acid biosynthesis glycosyltransferase TuaG
MPMISIITPLFNCQDYIIKCIKSVQNQKHIKYEHIIIDDGSTDDSWERLQDWAKTDDRIKIYHTDNRGMAAARKLALGYATGEWVAFLDADDEWMPEKLSIQMASADQADMVLSSGYYIGDFEGSWQVPDFDLTGDQLINRLLTKNFIPVLSVMVKRKLLSQVEAFTLERQYDVVADYDVWIRLCKQNIRIRSLGASYLFNYRIHQGQSTSISRKYDLLVIVLKLIAHHHELETINLRQAHAAYINHIREALDYFLSKTSKIDAEKVISLAKNYLHAKWTFMLIGSLIKVNLRLAQVLSWRLLKPELHI